MSGQADSKHRGAESARDFEVNHREGDRNPGLRRENFVQATIQRIVVVSLIPREPLLAEQKAVRRFHEARRAASSLADLNGLRIENPQRRLALKVREFEPREQQRRLVQFETLITAR